MKIIILNPVQELILILCNILAKIMASTVSKMINHDFLKPKALNIPNSYVFSSTSPIIRE